MNLWFYTLWLFVFISATFANVCVWLAVWILTRKETLLILSSSNIELDTPSSQS